MGAGADELVVPVLDDAGWRVSGKLTTPEGVELAFLLPHTPELRPAERLRPPTDEAVADEDFASLEDLDAALGERCRALAAMPEAIEGETKFGWWPADAPTGVAPS